jgi:hypothetical protein
VYYDLQDDGEDPTELEHNFGLVDRGHREKAALRAISTLTALANNRELAGVIDTGLSGLNGLRLIGPDGPVVVLWLDTPSGQTEIRLPHGLQATDILGRPLEFTPSGEAGDVRLTITEEGGPVYLR